MKNAARQENSAPVQALRGKTFKPRTSPYSFPNYGVIKGDRYKGLYVKEDNCH